MALCVALQADGTLLPTGEAVGECTGYVLVSSAEYGVYQVVQDAMAVPTPEQASGWFVGGFGAVMLFYVVGRMAGGVVSMFKS
jgi:hypothetical protein